MLMHFVIIQLQMTSNALRQTLKTPLCSQQQKGCHFIQQHRNQTKIRPLVQRNRISLGLGHMFVRLQTTVDSLMDFIEIYEWRSSTVYPIVCCSWKRVIFNKSLSFIANKNKKNQIAAQLACRKHSEKVSLWVQNQFIVPLQKNQLLSITQFLYAFKEALVGFERLYALFGSFEISSGMIGVNLDGKIRVWVSSYGHLNAKLDIDQKKLLGSQEQYMVSRIKEIFMKSASDSSTFREFFKGLSNMRTFIDCLKYIEDFAIFKKIMISKKILKIHKTLVKRPLSPIINLKPIARTPKFIAHIQQRKSKMQEPIPSLRCHQFLQSKNNFNFSELKTKETLNHLDFIDLSESSLVKAGKIVKNIGKKRLLSQVRSVQNLHNRQGQPLVDSKTKESTIQQQMRKLLQDDPQNEIYTQKTSLTQLGRNVPASVIIL